MIPNTPANAEYFQRQALALAPFWQLQESATVASNYFQNKLALHSNAHVFRASGQYQNLGRSIVCLSSSKYFTGQSVVPIFHSESLGGSTCPASFESTSVDTGLVSDFTGISPGRHLISKPFVLALTAPDIIPKRVLKVFNPRRLLKHIAITSDVASYKQCKCI